MISYDLFSIRSSKYDLFVYLRSDSFTETKNLPKICLARIVWLCSSIVSGAYLVFGMHKLGALPGSSFSNFSSMQGFYLHSSKILGYLPGPRVRTYRASWCKLKWTYPGYTNDGALRDVMINVPLNGRPSFHLYTVKGYSPKRFVPNWDHDGSRPVLFEHHYSEECLEILPKSWGTAVRTNIICITFSTHSNSELKRLIPMKTVQKLFNVYKKPFWGRKFDLSAQRSRHIFWLSGCGPILPFFRFRK